MSQGLLTDKQVRGARARAALPVIAKMARQDPSMFCRYVLRDEHTGKRIKQAPMHESWQQILTDSPRAVIWSHVEGGKTNQVAIGRVLWEVGRDPNLRVAIVSKTTEMAQKIVRALQQYIDPEDSPYEELRHVFPHLVPAKDPSLPWNSKALTVERLVVAKDPTIQATGIFGNILGSRVDLMIFDDVLDFQNTNTPAPREYVYEWIKSTAFGRLTENARVWVVGNAWHPEDAMHKIAKEPRFVSYRFPVVDPERAHTVKRDPRLGDCAVCDAPMVLQPDNRSTACCTLTWPERWSHKRIEDRKQDLSSPLEYARQLLCQARDDDTARFRKEWIERCLKLGAGKKLVRSRAELAAVLYEEADMPVPDNLEKVLDPLAPFGVAIFTGVDLAVKKHSAADLTCFFTTAVFLRTGMRRVLNIESGRWGSPDIRNRAIQHHNRYGSILIVENVAAQHYIIDMIHEKCAAPVIPYTTGRENKAHPEYGVESLAGEFAAGKWQIPCSEKEDTFLCAPEVDAWIGELLFYDPLGHTGDRVMGQWFSREGARTIEPRAMGAGATVTIIDGSKDDEDERAAKDFWSNSS